FGDLKVVWQHRTWGEANDPKFPWGATLYGDKGTLKLDVHKYELTPLGQKDPTLKGEALFEYDKYPEDRTEKDLEKHVSSAVRWHMKDLLHAIGTRGKAVADLEQGYISTTSCSVANLDEATRYHNKFRVVNIVGLPSRRNEADRYKRLLLDACLNIVGRKHEEFSKFKRFTCIITHLLTPHQLVTLGPAE